MEVEREELVHPRRGRLLTAIERGAALFKNLLEILALVVAAIWVFYTYISYPVAVSVATKHLPSNSEEDGVDVDGDCLVMAGVKMMNNSSGPIEFEITRIELLKLPHVTKSNLSYVSGVLSLDEQAEKPSEVFCDGQKECDERLGGDDFTTYRKSTSPEAALDLILRAVIRNSDDNSRYAWRVHYIAKNTWHGCELERREGRSMSAFEHRCK